MEKGYREGVSELHVLERALTAQISASLRETLASDDIAVQHTARLRALRAVELNLPADGVHKNLEAFRTKEIWEDDLLINKTHSPLALGDVFELDEESGNAPKKLYVLLGQPCDIALRPEGKRDADLGILLPLKATQQVAAGAGDKLKEIPLPVRIQDSYWVCDLRTPTTVRLDILDLASYRDDGKVRFDFEQAVPPNLLPGLAKKAEKLFDRMNASLAALKEIAKAAGGEEAAKT